MSQPYCGIGKVPKGRKRGTAKECAEVGQVRHWGEKKVDKRTLEKAKLPETIKETKSELVKQRSAALGSKKRLDSFIESLERELKRKDNPESKQKLKESKAELKKVERVLKLSTAKLKKILMTEEKEKKAAAAKKTKAALSKKPAQAAKEIPLKTRKKIVDKAFKQIATKKGTKKKVVAKKK